MEKEKEVQGTLIYKLEDLTEEEANKMEKEIRKIVAKMQKNNPDITIEVQRKRG